MARMLSLMFHRIHDPLNTNRASQFERFLKSLVRNYTIVLPNGHGIPLKKSKPAVCLTFDDAYYDFYHYVFPLLKKWDIQAILAVPVKAISDHTHAQASDRLSVPYIHHFRSTPSPTATPLCTWKELKEMAQSGHVIIASHGYRHADLTLPEANLKEEVEYSKALLEQQLGSSIDYFVYPYGRMAPHIHRYVRRHYRFGIRIGNAYNFRGNTQNGLIYRINADPFWKENININHPLVQLKLWLKYGSNRLRLR